MTLSRIVLSSFPLLLVSSVGCGGATLSGGTLFEPTPTHDDAGATDDAGSGTGTGTMPAAEPPTGTTCLSSSDCPTGETCAWLTSEDWCIAFNPAGTCVRPIVSGCGAIEEAIGCGCDGQDVSWETGCAGMPAGYAPVGVAHAGPCESPAIDAGFPVTVDASEPQPEPEMDAGVDVDADVDASTNPCDPTVDGVCPEGQQCGYPIGACGSVARCLPGEEWGLCNSIEAACTCTGMTIAIPGCAEAASVAVAYAGRCPGSDAGF